MTALDVSTVFLDRDGVINDKRPNGDYVGSWSDWRFRARALEALRLLSAAGKRLIIVTNQRGVARGLVTAAEVADIHARMLDRLRLAGVRCDAIYVCPHEIGACSCRKPGVGLFLQAQRDFPGLDFRDAAVVGDSLADMEAGTRLGCANFLVAPVARRNLLLKRAASTGVRVDGVGTSLWEVALRHLIGSTTRAALETFRPHPPATPVMADAR